MNYVFNTRNAKRYEFPTHINEIVVDRAESGASEVFMVIVEPGKAVHAHRHDDCEQVMYVIEGRGALTVGADKKEHDVGPAQVVRIPAGTLHTVRAKGKKPIRYLCIDCFLRGARRSEPTWDDHVRAICRDKGYDFDRVAVHRKKKKM